MRSKYTWLLLPPALALFLVFGPLQSMTQGKTKTNAPAASETTGQPTTPSIGSNLPELPGLWQVASSLVGVLLLGGTLLFAFKHFRNSGNARPMAPTELLSLRQSLRLSPKHKVHAVEFDGQVLLIGCSDQHVTLLSSQAETGLADDIAVASRRIDEEDEGAVPRDMVLPRPKRPRKVAPKAPRSVQRDPATAKGSGARVEAEKTLQNFRALLQKAQAQGVAQ